MPTDRGPVPHTLTITVTEGHSPSAGYEWETACSCHTRWSRIGWAATLTMTTDTAADAWRDHLAAVTR